MTSANVNHVRVISEACESEESEGNELMSNIVGNRGHGAAGDLR